MRIIHGTLADLSYVSPQLPSYLSVGGHPIANISFLGQGLKPGSSFVYRVNCGEEQAILKLNRTEREVFVAGQKLQTL